MSHLSSTRRKFMAASLCLLLFSTLSTHPEDRNGNACDPSASVTAERQQSQIPYSGSLIHMQYQPHEIFGTEPDGSTLSAQKLMSDAGLIAYYLAIACIVLMLLVSIRHYLKRHGHQLIDAGTHFLSSARPTLSALLSKLVRPDVAPTPLTTPHANTWNIEITLASESFVQRSVIHATLETQALPVLSKERNLIVLGPFAEKSEAADAIRMLYQRHGIRSWLVAGMTAL